MSHTKNHQSDFFAQIEKTAFCADLAEIAHTHLDEFVLSSVSEYFEDKTQCLEMLDIIQAFNRQMNAIFDKYHAPLDFCEVD